MCIDAKKVFRLGSDVNPDPTTSKLLKNGRIIKLVGKKKDCTATDPVGKKLRIINFQQTNKVFHLKIFSIKTLYFPGCISSICLMTRIRKSFYKTRI